MQFQLLTDQVEAAADLQRPALAVAGHHVPAMHVADIQAAGDPHVVERTGEVKARTERAVHAGVLPAHQRGDFAERGAVDCQVEIDAAGVGIPAALQGERSQALRRTVGARGLGRNAIFQSPPEPAGEISRSVSVR